MLLDDLLRLTNLKARGSTSKVMVSGICADSRQVMDGDIFVAWIGENFDGHRYIKEAIEAGAVAVVGTRDLYGLDVPFVQVQNSQQALASLSAALYDFPARKLTVIGVTGTDGKTTTTNLIHALMVNAGLKAGMISTVNAVVGNQVLDTGFHVTTPDAPQVQKYLSQMVAAGLTHTVLETTSHGLAQHRVDECEIDVAVITNITHEHLDYHGSYEDYRAAKGRLFNYLENTVEKPQGNPRLAVLNRDDDSYQYLSAISGRNQVSYGLSQHADIRAEMIENCSDGLQFVIIGNGFRFAVKTALVGIFNVYNCLAAAAVGILGLGISLEKIREGIAQLQSIPGRMERISMGQDFTALVDFAHTPNALARALETAQSLTQGDVIVVFGSAGLRDRQKRKMMAEIAVQIADYSILTAEDPRTESLDEILEEMAVGARKGGGNENKDFIRIADRGGAIMHAVQLAKPGDLVIICGKGHEQSMCFGEVEYPWDDRIALQAALSEHIGIAGPKMPYLPTQDV